MDDGRLTDQFHTWSVIHHKHAVEIFFELKRTKGFFFREEHYMSYKTVQKFDCIDLALHFS